LRYYSYREFMLRRYGEPLQRVPIDSGFGCPNRNADGSGGCSFCAEDGGRAVQTLRAGDWREQIDAAKAFARERYGATRFMGYCQAYTGTNAAVNVQADFFRSVLEYGEFEAFTIGTRPDCLPPATIELFRKLREKVDLWVELGVQTANDATLRRINRGHTWESSRRAIEQLHAAGIPVAVHLIFGLPGESEEDWRVSSAAVAALPISGIKFHNLHIVRGSELERQYLSEPFELPDEHDYAEAVIYAIRLLPQDVPVMRLQSDTLPQNLLAPHWMMKKGQFADYVKLQMERRGLRQGDLRPGQAKD